MEGAATLDNPHNQENYEKSMNNRKATSNDIAIKINSMKLIRSVRGQEVLYNSFAEGYSDKNHKELIWERIYRSLFPFYDTYMPEHQDIIRMQVRRRWKTLRDSISREVKKNATVENYSRKKESPIIAELEFLIPHIKSAHCAKLADELGLRECYNSTIPSNDEIQEDGDSSNDLIDLTEEFDIKPFIKQDGFDYDEMDNCDDSIPHAILSTELNTDVQNGHTNGLDAIPASNADESIHSTWNKEFCTVAQYKGGEFINPVELCADQGNGENEENVEKENGAVAEAVAERETDADKSLLIPANEISPAEPTNKRPRKEPEESSKELQAKILQLLSSLEHRERTDHEAQDEDRMFLLSLVSDLKRVPAAKKMTVKMEIVTAIARANQNQ